MERPTFRWQSLSTRVTLLALVCFLVGAWSITFFISQSLQADMERQLGAQQFSTVTLIADQIRQEVDERADALSKVAIHASGVPQQDLPQLLRQLPVLPALFNGGIQILDPAGHPLATLYPQAQRQPPLPALSPQDLARVLHANGAVITTPAFNADLQAPTVNMAWPLRSPGGQAIGALVGLTRLDRPNFLSKVIEKRYGQTGGYVVTDGRSRQIMAATDAGRVMESLPAPGVNPVIDRFESGYQGSDVLTNARGVELLVSVTRIKGPGGWHAVVTLPTEEAFSSVRAMKQRAQLAATIMSLLACSLMWWRLKRLLSPLSSTAQELTRITHANAVVTAPLPVVRPDEIGELINAFNGLLSRLAQRESELKESEFRWKFAVEGSGDGVWDWNLETGQSTWSPRSREIMGLAPDGTEPINYQAWIDLIHPDDRALIQLAVQSCLQGRTPTYHHEYRIRLPDETIRWVLSRGMVVMRGPHGEPLRMIGTDADITSRKRVEQFELFRSHVLQQLTEGQGIQLILDTLVQGVEALDPAMRCSVLLLDSERRHLLTGAAPSLPAFYNQAIHGVAIGEGVGSCGTAAATGKLVIVEDIKTHPYWVGYSDLAIQAGLQSCWSQPILGTVGEVLGTFAIYHAHPHRPSNDDLHLIEQCGRLASIAIVHARDEARLRQAANVFSHAREGIMITDARGIIIEVNDAFRRITGYPREEVLGKNPNILKSGRQDASFYEAMWGTLTQQGYWSGEIWNRRKDGREFAELITISAVRDEFGQTSQYVGLFSDITAIKEHERRLEHIAHFDALTGLPNRVLLADRLHQAMSQARRRQQKLAVAYLDLDGFKAINDHHGHEAGDQLLTALATRMKATLREGDTLARLGGDEFVAVLLDVTAVEHCIPILNRLLEAAASQVPINGQTHQVSASLGLTIYPQGEEVDADQLLRQADQAMYQAKVAGKNRYHLFDSEQDRSVRGHHASIEHIRLALHRQQFVLHYQPKVNMRTGDVIGVEALIRWQHPEKGLVPPGQFLPVIEEHPLAVELGEWVINEALSQMSRWQSSGLHLPISVNVGARQLQQPDFLDRLRLLLSGHPELEAGSLELEVLETSALDDLGHVTEVMQSCLAMGVRFALDDFGTGYSSLTYLKRLPVSLLKIDQSFVRDMQDDPDDLAILKGILGLSDAFHREVIAEGVETDAHGRLLLQLGCELGQGYGIARPMPAADIPGWIEAWRPPASWSDARAN